MDIDKIKYVIKIQNIFRNRVKIKNRINNEIALIYQITYSVMNRIQLSFEKGLIEQLLYNKSLSELTDILTLFKKFNYPIRLSYFYNNSPYKLLLKITEIKKKLIYMIQCHGTMNINDIMCLILNYNIYDCDNKNSSNYRLYKFYDRTFVPISCSMYIKVLKNTKKGESKLNIKNLYQNTELEKKGIFLESISKASLNNLHKYDLQQIQQVEDNLPFIRKCVDKSNILIKELYGARFYANHNDKVIVCNGYFKDDPLNISRIGGSLGEKNSDIEKSLKHLIIPDIFKEAFLEQLSLRDFILLSNSEILDMCIEYYNDYKSYKSKTITSLVKEFVISDLSKQRYIITLFLLNKDNIDNQSISYLLYDILSTDSQSIKNNKTADILFNSLHWTVQKLFKSAKSKIDKLNNKLKNFKEDSISYEKRILLLNCSNSIKQKAFEKLKELNSSKGDTNAKAQQYIDGLLKIPFGVYKEENIISFLNSFKMNIINLSKDIENLFNITNYEKKFKTTKSYLKKLLDSSNYILKNKDNIISYDIEKFVNCVNKNFNLIEDLLNTYKNKINEDKKQKLDKKLENYKKLNCKQLKTILEERNLKKNGKKNDLIKRLVDYDSLKMKVKKIENTIISNSLIKLYKTNNYKELRKSVQNINKKWNNYNKDKKQYINQVSKTLDNTVYGLTQAKKQIKRVIAQWINGDMKGYVFGFEGPPGTGKTTLAKLGIANCLKDDDGKSRPFAFIALGGSSNGSTLEGHNYTYVGSTWGRIVDILMQTQCMNPIIYIDELDKISKTEHGKEIVGILTHLTDTTQNDSWTDKYFAGVKLDLSKTLFIFSYNDPDNIDRILLDRIHIIKTKPLNRQQKTAIIQDYVLPKMLNTIGFRKGDIIFPDEVIGFIINSYTYEAGVRKLKEKIFEVTRDINLQYLMGEAEFDFPLTVTNELVEKIFSENVKMKVKKINNCPKVGLVNGLYATSRGIGGLTIIEAYKCISESKLSLELTGKQGDVMKESMKVSKTVAWNLISDEKQKEILDNSSYGIHIHCPEGATPKDGPSAGVAITTSILSLLLNLPVNNKVAVTGEIDLNGNVHEIGGLISKLEGARIAGVNTVLIPKDNEDTFENIKKQNFIEFNENFKVVLIENIREAIEYLLLSCNKDLDKTKLLRH